MHRAQSPQREILALGADVIIRVCAALMLLTMDTAQAQGWPAPINRYLEILQVVEASQEPVSLEPLFAAAEEVQDTVMQIEGDQAWLETLSDSDFSALSRSLRGLRLARGYDVFAQPDPEFLNQLARDHGHAVDRAFFALYRRSWGDDLIPTYLRLTSRVAPCVRFSEGVIPELYLGWLDYRREHSDSYVAYAEQSIRDLEETVELGTCACGDANSVEHELSGFLQRFPKSPAAPGILKRLQQLEDDPDQRPVRCR